MERNDVTTINGREFVSVDEFVRRMDTTRQTLEKRKPKNDSFMAEKENPGKPHMESASIPQIEKSSVQKEKLLDISDIDPKLLEDCSVNGVIDWDLAKKKLTALTYAYDLDVKKGKYIEKAEVQMWAMTLAKILESNLSSLPNKYASILEAEVVAMVRSITGKVVDISDESKTKMKKLMNNVAPEIFKSIQETLEKYNENE